VNDGLLSVLVQNVGPAEIRSARVFITARDRFGAIVASNSSTPGALCCTVLGLAPNATFGLYDDLGAAARRTSSVEVDYADLSLDPQGVPPTITATQPQLAAGQGVTIVRTSLSAASGAGPYVAVQATLRNPAGRLVAVVSGRFYCVFPGRNLGVTLQLFHAVPAGTQVGEVAAYSIPAGTTTVTSALPACTSP
jgi:hypothetical protein